MPTLVIHGASTVPFHRSINDAVLRALPNGRSFELAGGHNSPASSPEYFVEAWQSFGSQTAPREGRDASFDAVLATVEAAQVQLVSGQPGPFKALWSQSLRETIRFKNPADRRAMVQELRVTQVFRREDGRWRIVHRHADSQVVRTPTG